MTLDRLTIRIDAPSDSLPPGRGFYQLEEDILFVPIGRPPRTKTAFFSFLESEIARLDIDTTGRLLFAEISRSRRLWEVIPDLKAPAGAPYADVRWLDFREQFVEPRILTNQKRDVVCIQFADRPDAKALRLADSVILESDADNVAVRLWVTEIVDDLAGRNIAALRHPDHQSPHEI
jgi:hypothetical protein